MGTYSWRAKMRQEETTEHLSLKRGAACACGRWRSSRLFVVRRGLAVRVCFTALDRTTGLDILAGLNRRRALLRDCVIDLNRFYL